MATSGARAVTLTVVAIAASALCIAAGLWQGQRTRDAIDLERAALAAAVPASEAMTTEGFPAMSVGRGAFATGSYGQQQLFVGPRESAGRSGWWVVAPLQTPAGTVAVIRGWVDNPGSPATAVPSGQVDVSGTLQPFEEFYADRPRSPDGNLVVLSRSELEAEWDTAVLALALVLEGQEPLTPPAPEPITATVSMGSVPFPWQNAAYTLQWFVFAVFVWIMWWMWVVRGRRETADDDSLRP